jgi:predicted RNA-binding Zn ribbon-like protein
MADEGADIPVSERWPLPVAGAYLAGEFAEAHGRASKARSLAIGAHVTSYSRDVLEMSTEPADLLPEWELVFRFTMGRLCLAFCATVGERWRRNFERLRSPADLARWVLAAQLVADQPAADGRALEQARALREAIYRLVRAGMAGQIGTEKDRALLNAWARHPGLAPQLDTGGHRYTLAGTRPLRACLATVARDAVDLLTSPEIGRVRVCEAPDCALLFVDRSRPGRRRWCSDRACGTKTRSAAYRQRHAHAS